MRSLKLFLCLFFLTGVIYPFLITVIAQITMSHTANGSLIEKEGKIVGSDLIGQKFASEKYFWSRPSSIDYQPLPSGGSNLSPTSAQLKKEVEKRKIPYAQEKDAIPSDLLLASGSGLDPHISPAAAQFQINRVAKARGMDSKDGREKIEILVKEHTCSRFLGILGRPGVNVLTLNIALDEATHKHD